MEEWINELRPLCFDLLNTKDPEEVELIGEDLRSAIHEHIEHLRHNVPKELTVFEAVLIS